jgi:hypothetical protein
MKSLWKFFFKVVIFFTRTPTLKCGDSMNFIGMNYTRGNIVPLHINDEVIIRPVPGRSQATISYPAKIVAQQVKGKDGRAEGNIWVLTVCGIRGNEHSRWINDYLFGRLEFVLRKCKEESSWEIEKENNSLKYKGAGRMAMIEKLSQEIFV